MRNTITHPLEKQLFAEIIQCLKNSTHLRKPYSNYSTMLSNSINAKMTTSHRQQQLPNINSNSLTNTAKIPSDTYKINNSNFLCNSNNNNNNNNRNNFIKVY